MGRSRTRMSRAPWRPCNENASLFIIPFIVIPQGWVALILYFSGSSFIKEKRLLNRELKHREAARRPIALIIGGVRVGIAFRLVRSVVLLSQIQHVRR